MEENNEDDYIILDSDVKLLGKFSYDEIELKDPGLKKYICLKPRYIPHSFGRHADTQFNKAQVPIVERLINKLMSPGRGKDTRKTHGFGGKKKKATRIVLQALEIIKREKGEKPLQVLCNAVENAAPREEIVKISRGGIYRRYSVDVAPQRRLDLTLRFLVRGGRKKATDSPKKISECLTEEIISAANDSLNSYAIKKKADIERIAENAR